MGIRLGSCRLIPVQPLIRSIIRAFSISLLSGYLRFCVVYIDTVSIKQITAPMVDGCRSKLANVVSGVLEGSVLGPLLSPLLTSDLWSVLEIKLISYADAHTWLSY